ncbi:hypothetical protein H4F18_10585 [Vibrio scophthalmi]|uniref:hypothetical protein n=1 Tax=Vibrio scophthalmi TaxID=45658 RepID=UPI002FF0086B
MNEPHVCAQDSLLLEQAGWTLTLAADDPQRFTLCEQGEVRFSGVLEVMANGQVIDLSQTEWRFRAKPNRLEQWCQIEHSQTLSLNMNYTFVGDALVIEYLGRNSLPTRLDVRHSITYLAKRNAEERRQPEPFSPHHQRQGLPSEFLSKTAKTDYFREAFAAKQWIILENCEA